uniref:Uncharacterized protein n=1 Tax=Sphaerodactylus townsendi TaxID=933632 RepID=A0ACB8EZ08_9SAUR
MGTSLLVWINLYLCWSMAATFSLGALLIMAPTSIGLVAILGYLMHCNSSRRLKEVNFNQRCTRRKWRPGQHLLWAPPPPPPPCPNLPLEAAKAILQGSSRVPAPAFLGLLGGKELACSRGEQLTPQHWGIRRAGHRTTGTRRPPMAGAQGHGLPMSPLAVRH